MRADSEQAHARVYSRDGNPVIELLAERAGSRWTVLARWRLAGEGEWLSHVWEAPDERHALELLDAVAIGIVAVIGEAQMAEAAS